MVSPETAQKTSTKPHPASLGQGSAEQQGHLLIGHTLLLAHSHGLTQVHGQDVFALEGREQRETFTTVIKDTVVT